MDEMILPKDFRDFLKLLHKYYVEYLLLIGGYAVFYRGYPRATEVEVIRSFGLSNAIPDLFLQEHQPTRIGFKPYRVVVLTTISGVKFEECYARRVVDIIDGIEVNIISLGDLKHNKESSGRLKDQDDVQNLP